MRFSTFEIFNTEEREERRTRSERSSRAPFQDRRHSEQRCSSTSRSRTGPVPLRPRSYYGAPTSNAATGLTCACTAVVAQNSATGRWISQHLDFPCTRSVLSDPGGGITLVPLRDVVLLIERVAVAFTRIDRLGHHQRRLIGALSHGHIALCLRFADVVTADRARLASRRPAHLSGRAARARVSATDATMRN